MNSVDEEDLNLKYSLGFEFVTVRIAAMFFCFFSYDYRAWDMLA